jgi:peptidyl-tRNA hydrolase, PTH1 family
MIKLILGLGNPGMQYQQTRHNAGFDFVQAWTKTYPIDFKSENKLRATVGSFNSHQGRHLVAMPTTFMNECGQSVQALLSYYKIAPDELMIAHDELDLPVGQVRIKSGGGHGGHNGLRSIFKHIGPEFWRVRIGIGHPGHKDRVSGYVLSKAGAKERIEMLEGIDLAMTYSENILNGEFDQVMKALHTSKG